MCIRDRHRAYHKAQAPDTSGCKAIPVTDVRRLHRSHDIRFAQGPWGAKPLAYCTKCGHYTRRRLADLGGWCKGACTASGALTSAYRLYLRTIKRGIHPTIASFRLGKHYKPNISFSPASDTGSFEADHKAANLCLLRSPVREGSEPAIHSNLLELEALEAEAAEAEASLRRLAAAAAVIDEHESWLSQEFDSYDP